MKMLHDMKLQDQWFQRLLDGTKNIELRLYDTKRKTIELGDIIRFTNGQGQTATFTVTALLRANTFAQLLEYIPTECVTGGCATRSEMLTIMETIYPVAQQKQHGVLGIALAPCSTSLR